MSMQQIRDRYGVPAKRGARIRFDGTPGRITSAMSCSAHLRAVLDDGTRVILHPTWHVEYLGETP